MITFPNSKINLGLNITSRREDGYHDLETIFYPIDICDALEINIIDSDSEIDDKLIIHGIEIDGSVRDNLVMRAVKLVREEFDFPPIKINLLKKIPTGAGLGGGSSDAAFTLKLLNEIFQLNMSLEKMASLALKLGADCPFFIYNSPMYAEGIGEILSPIVINLENYFITVVKPDIFISTKEAFEGFVPKPSKYNLKETVAKPIEDWKNYLKNDFEETLFPKYPLLKEIKENLYKQGALYSSMTGSGAAIYALSDKPIKNLYELYPNFFIWSNKI